MSDAAMNADTSVAPGSRSPDCGRRARRYDRRALTWLRKAGRAFVRKVGSGWRHRFDLSRHASGFRATCQSRAAGFSDSSEQADLYLNALIGEATNRELRNAYLPNRTEGDRLLVRSVRCAVSSRADNTRTIAATCRAPLVCRSSDSARAI